MSHAWDPDDDSPQVRYDRRMLEPRIATVRNLVTEEYVRRMGVEVAVEHSVQGMIVQLHKTIASHRLKTHQEDVEAWIEVPYEHEVMIEPEPRWWHRWYKPEPRWVTVKGKIRRRGSIKVKVDHLLTFPDSNKEWPSYMGKPVSATEVTVLSDPRWTQHEPDADGRPWAAERWTP